MINKNGLLAKIVVFDSGLGSLSIIKEIQKFMPEADSELNSMTQTLNGLMMDSLAGDSFNMESAASNEETDRILQEASAVAEQQIGEKFPSIPTSTGLSSQTSSTSSFD